MIFYDFNDLFSFKKSYDRTQILGNLLCNRCNSLFTGKKFKAKVMVLCHYSVVISHFQTAAI